MPSSIEELMELRRDLAAAEERVRAQSELLRRTRNALLSALGIGVLRCVEADLVSVADA